MAKTVTAPVSMPDPRTTPTIDQVGIEERVARFDNEGLRESLRNYYRSGQGLDAISGAVLSNKVYERIRAILSGEAPDLATLAAEAAEDEEE